MIGWYINDEGEQQMYVYSPFKPTQAMFMMDMASKIIECRPPDLVDDFDWDAIRRKFIACKRII